MGKGRKPTPTRIKALMDNPGKRPMNDAEPQFTVGAEPPAWLDEAAQAEWWVVASELSALGMLTRVDGMALASYCMACSLLQQAQKDISIYGITVPSESGRRKNPAATVANDMMRTIRSLGSEFGFTPSSRTRVRQPGTEPDPLDKFLQSAAG